MNDKKLFQSITIGGINVKNRFFRSTTHEAYANKGKPEQKLYEIYENLAKGGVGLISMGYFVFAKSDHYGAKELKMDSEILTSLKTISDMVHSHDTKIIAQLNHCGGQLFEQVEGKVYGPSEYIDPVSGITTTAFTTIQIKDLIKEFGQAALIAKKAGFDGVQIHGAHGYLLNKFMNPDLNKRTDEYGGNAKKNIQIIVDILHEIKNICGKDFPVWIKLNSSDFDAKNRGVTEELFLAIGEELSKKGMDAIEVSGGSLVGEYSFCRAKKHSAYHLDAAKKLSEKVDTSIILVGGIRDLDIAESVLAETKIDGISLSRALIREPDLIQRWHSGDRTPAKCVACNGCFNFNGVRCFFSLNAEEKKAQRLVMKMMQSKN